MTGNKEKFYSIFFLNNIPPVNIVDGTSFTIPGKGVVPTISSLSLNDVLFVPKFPFSLPSIAKLLHKNRCCAIFYPSYCVFQNQ